MTAALKLPEWAIGGAALAIGGAALYLYFRGSKGVAKDAVGAVGGVISGTIEGAGEAFQDVTQATFGVPKTDPGQCQKDLAAGSTWDASFSCPAGSWLRSLFTTEPKPAATYTKSPVTAPGGGVIDKSTFYSLFDGPNDGSCVATFNNPVPCPVAGTGTNYLPDSWASNWAPSNPIPVNQYGATSLFSVAGIRG